MMMVMVMIVTVTVDHDDGNYDHVDNSDGSWWSR